MIAGNISELRKKNGMTQAELAEKIGYSDKSVSKWERGDGIPDVICLKTIAELFGVTVDYMLTDVHDEDRAKERSGEECGLPQGGETEQAPCTENEPPKYTVNRTAIVLVSVAGVWLLAFLSFMILYLCGTDFSLSFAIACPVSAILLIVFNGLWGNSKFNFLLITFLVWSVLFLVCYAARAYNIWLLMCVGFPATFVVWISTRIKKQSREE